MKDTVLPCVCTGRKPNIGDSVYFGMPILRVSNTMNGPEYSVVCPNCGRGGPPEYKSANAALRAWNKLQQKEVSVW